VKTPKSKVEAKHSGKNNSRKNGAAALATPDCPVAPESPVGAAGLSGGAGTAQCRTVRCTPPDCPVKPEGPVVAPDSLVQPRELEFQNPKLDQILSKHQKKWRNS